MKLENQHVEFATGLRITLLCISIGVLVMVTLFSPLPPVPFSLPSKLTINSVLLYTPQLAAKKVDMVIVPVATTLIGVLPGRIATIAELKRGLLFVHEGADVTKRSVTLMVLSSSTNAWSIGNWVSSEINADITNLLAVSVGAEGPDPYKVELYLEEILPLMQLGEDYANFVTSKIKAPTSVDLELPPRATKAFCNHAGS
ncbi:hypothetical protein VNO77_04563 [Canavalia gladiata]|uniref:Uncharacterized protein n=1 Tax=Canavalia gladiata TaxID=3824 RepID=A0AAN9R969_CANGL